MGVISSAHALSDQWYIGLGGTGSWLTPNPREPGLDVAENVGTGGTLFIGRDLDNRSSIQFQLHGLGAAEFDNGIEATYASADAAVLYRLFDSRDRSLGRGNFGLALYGQFALGYMYRDSEQSLEDDAPVHFSFGLGAETFLTRNFSLRTEAIYHESDAASGNVALVFRFGGTPSPVSRAPAVPTSPVSPPEPEAVPLPVPEVPKTVDQPAAESVDSENIARNADQDADGIANGDDQCLDSQRGFPVRENGCPLFDGVLSGVRFVEGTARLEPGSERQLDSLVNVLLQYPEAKIELHSHSDNSGSLTDQSVLTRARLRTVGTYLLERGIRSNRMTLRSFGGAKPRFDNATEEGKQRNNRIEVFEKRQ